MKQIPYGYHWITKEDIKTVADCLSGKWITQGPHVKAFETELFKSTGAKYAVAVSSGTAALHIAALALSLKPGDEVITSPITFAASANCVLYCGARPVFADIEIDTGNLDPKEIEKMISSRTKAIIPVHYSGHPCDIEKINKIAKKHDLAVIEDAAHTLGAKYKFKGRWHKVGCCLHSDMTILSFHPVKHITTGEGGAVLTNSPALYKKLLMLRTHGITKENFVNKPHGGWYYEMQALGYNYRITDFQCALGISQIKKLNKFVKRRREIAHLYDKAFKNNRYFDTPQEKEYAYPSYHIYPIRLKAGCETYRREIFEEFRKNGLGVQVHYIPVYLQPYYSKLGYKKGACPDAERFYNSEISIPMYPLMKNSDVRYVIKTIFKALAQY
jgi:UDP-4-amino-4,6-dideoxy-N-acetyl-beta-L-altrosamine transaminase